MNVVVSKHAVERFLDWQRTTTLNVAPEKAEQVLARAARRGRVVSYLPGGALEVEHRGLYLVVKKKRDGLAVITFNGDRAWRNWYRKQHLKAKYQAKVRAIV
ncbi:MAG: hypothetical protein AB1330_10580 [Bacillota bacterium]